ncbi:MAG: DUF2934 domain-containing protein [Chloroflexota bacterium]
MATEEQIKQLAYTIWEQEGRPAGKEAEHYFRARQILEKQEAENVIELGPAPPTGRLAPSAPAVELTPPTPRKKRRIIRHRKKAT